MQKQAVDIQSVLSRDLYSDPTPAIADVKQVIDTLKDKVQPLTVEQMKAIGYLKHLQSRPIHNGKEVYKHIIEHIQDEAPRVAPPGFFIRVIESLIPRPISVDLKTYEKMKKESEGN